MTKRQPTRKTRRAPSSAVPHKKAPTKQPTTTTTRPPHPVEPPPISDEPGAPMTGQFHTAEEFKRWMRPIGPVICETRFLRDPRFNQPLSGQMGGKRMWITVDSLASTRRILREGWPELERAQRELEVRREAHRREQVEERKRQRASGVPAPKRPRGRPPKRKPDTEPAATTNG